jgi:Domain of unknown function (DUF222)
MFAVEEAVPEKELLGVELAGLADAQAEEEFADVQRICERWEAERLRRLADVERRRIHERGGHLSITSWLSSQFCMSWGTAKRLVCEARGLEQMPETQEALAAGEISSSALDLLVRAREADPEAFARSEAVLVEAARRHPIGDLSRVLAHWALLAESERYPDLEQRFQARRGLHASSTLYGMTRTDGNLTPEVGGVFRTALSAVMDAEAHGAGPNDGRTPAQRRHDALGVICRAFLDSKDRPCVGGERPHLSVSVDLETCSRAPGPLRPSMWVPSAPGSRGRWRVMPP